MLIRPEEVYPSQEILKPETVKYIFNCIRTKKRDHLPPPPIVRKINSSYIAIDGHNLLAVYYYLKEPIEVHVATNNKDTINESTEGATERNAELRIKFRSVLKNREVAKLKGINTFSDLIAKYSQLFS
jgi:hypothetical protein